MKKILMAFIVSIALSTTAWGMYGEDTEPSDTDSQYTIDKEDSSDITMPEMKTDMPEAMQDIYDEQKDDPDENYVEDNASGSMRESLGY